MTLEIVLQVPDFWQVMSWATGTVLTAGNLILNYKIYQLMKR